MRVIDTSAPSVNIPMPRISRAEPNKNDSISPTSTGTSTRQSTATIAETGRTDAAASLSFSTNTFWRKPLLPFRFLSFILPENRQKRQ